MPFHSRPSPLRHQIRFFLRLKHMNVPFPMPPHVASEAQYLLTAAVVEGHEEAGPVAYVPFDCSHVIGLQPHHMLSPFQVPKPTHTLDLLTHLIDLRQPLILSAV